VDENNRDIGLQKIQALDSYFHAWFNTGASIWVGGFIALLILVVSLYYEGKLDLILTLISTLAVYAILGYSGMWFMNKRSNEFLAFVDKLLAQVEKGERLPSLMELKKQIRKK